MSKSLGTPRSGIGLPLLLALGIVSVPALFRSATSAEPPPRNLERQISKLEQTLARKSRKAEKLATQIESIERKLADLNSLRPEAAAIAQIKAVCGNFEVDANRSGRPVVTVSFFDPGSLPRFTDEDVSRLHELKELVSLEFDHNGIGDVTLANISVLSKLESLSIWETGITDASLPHVGKIVSLNALWLDGTQLSDKGVRHLVNLKSLEHLSLYGADLSDAAVPCLCKLKKLKTLSILNTRITDKGVAQLRESLPACKIVWRHRTASENQR